MSWNGLFSKPVYNTVGDPYVQRKDPPARGIGGELKPIVTRGAKGGHEGNFGPVAPLFEGEQYVEPGIARRRLKKNTKPFITEKAFKVSSPARKHATPGDGFGTFGGVPEATRPEVPEPARRRAEDEVTARNFITSPAKRGGYGVVGTTFGEYEYIPQREGGARVRAEPGEGEEDKKPFVPPARGGGLLHSYKATGAPTFLGPDDSCLPDAPDPYDGLSKKEIAERKQRQELNLKEGEDAPKPFMPSRTPRTGAAGAFGNYEHAEKDPFDPTAVQRAQATSRILPRAVRTANLPEHVQELPEFKPSSTPKQGLTRPTALPRVISPAKLESMARARKGGL